MKIFMLMILCSILGNGTSFAGKLLDDYEKDNDIHKQSDFKASPKIDFHNNSPAKLNTGLQNGNTGPKDTSPLYGNKPNNLNDSSGNFENGKRDF